MTDTVALIAFGSNLSIEERSPERLIADARDALEARGARFHVMSRTYRTPAFPAGAGPDYANAAALVTFDGYPETLLEVLHDVEAGFDRVRARRWAARTMDLDLLDAGGMIRPDMETWQRWRGIDMLTQTQSAPDRLILPHPRLQDRAFVLVPLAEVAPDWRHPVTGLSASEMLDALPVADRHAIVPWEDQLPLVNPAIAG